MPGIVTMTALMGASFAGAGLMDEMLTGSHERLLVSPLHRSALLVGRAAKEVVPMLAQTAIILLGDALNNYHATQHWVLKELRQKARRLYWLNPEPRGYWDTGDSVVSEYGVHCDGVYECRNLRQLERFVAAVIEA